MMALFEGLGGDMNYRKSFALVCASGLLLTGCGDGEGGGSRTPTPNISGRAAA
jgi:hypothetical protein